MLALKAFGRDDDSHMAAGMAYCAILSIFPLLLVVLAIGGLIYYARDENSSWPLGLA